MKTGNKNQATILGIVAVGAIGFLVIQLIPAKIRPMLGQGPAAIPVVAPTSMPVDLPLALVGDPFSHPKLAVKAPPTQAGQSFQPDITGNIPLMFGGLPTAVGQVQPTGSTEDIAGKDRLKLQGPQITVLAVMDAGTPVAMLQVGGKEAKTYRAGDALAKHVRLILVGHSFVEVKIGEDVVKIENGDTYGAEDGGK